MGLYKHFVDFEAFDSVHRESLWNIMRAIMRVIAGIYEGSECAGIDGRETSTGLRSRPK